MMMRMHTRVQNLCSHGPNPSRGVVNVYRICSNPVRYRSRSKSAHNFSSDAARRTDVRLYAHVDELIENLLFIMNGSEIKKEKRSITKL